jgi:serine/threonine-protein kinase
MATPVMTEAETMAMTGSMRQPMGATAMTRPIPGAMPPRQPERRSSWVMAVLAALGVLAVVALGIGLALSRDNNKNTQPPATASMPKLTGLSEAEAKTKLTNAGFTSFTAGAPVVTNNCNNKVESQNPAPNTSIRVDQPVSYTMCKSPDKTRVPGDLVGGTQDAAAAALQQANLQGDFQQVSSLEKAGIVVAVEKEGQQVDLGTTITVKVSKGDLVPVPSVVGKSLEGASAILQSNGFNVSTEIVQEQGTPGTVVRQTPAGKSRATRNSKVTIFVIDPNPTPSDSQSPSPGDTSTTGSGGGLLN